MLFIMGFSGAIMSFCAWIGLKDCWLATQMTHVAWHGFRHHDTIFPLFLFLAGVAWPFSHASQVAKGRTTGAILRKIGFRVLALFLLGMVSANFFAFKFETYRYDSVLAHIAVCWAGAALLYMFVRSWKVRVAIVFALLAYDDLFVSVRFMDGRLASLRVRSGTHYSGRTKRFILADGKIVSAEIGTEWKELAKLSKGS